LQLLKAGQQLLYTETEQTWVQALILETILLILS